MTGSLLRRPRTSAQPQGATFIELFFDLVFVYAMTQVTSMLLHDLSWRGAAQAVVVAWLIWWAWTQFTWTLSPADTTHPVVDFVVLVATAVAFFMARSVNLTFGDDPFLFLVPYLAIRVVGMGLYAWVGGDTDRQMARSMGLFALASLPAAAMLCGGAFLEPGPRVVVWALAIVLDLAAGVAVRRVQWRVHVSHFAERHGLFVIIALGESLIAVGVGSASLEASVTAYVAKGVAVALVCGLWWVYFAWFKAWLEEQAETSGSIDLIRNAYSFAHFVVVAGVVGIAAALEVAVAHPTESISPAAAGSLAVGLSAYVGGIALLAWLAGRMLLGPRLVILGVLVVFLIISPAQGLSGSLAVAVPALAIALVGLIEHRGKGGRSIPLPVEAR